jgi:hypothetical protein
VDFVAVIDQVITLLRQRGRLTYRTLQRQFQLDAAALEDLTVELIKGQRLAADEDGEVLVWIGDATAPPAPAVAPAPAPAPLTYTPPYLAEKILTSRSGPWRLEALTEESISPRGGLQRTWSMHGKGSIIEDLVWGYPREGD